MMSSITVSQWWACYCSHVLCQCICSKSNVCYVHDANYWIIAKDYRSFGPKPKLRRWSIIGNIAIHLLRFVAYSFYLNQICILTCIYFKIDIISMVIFLLLLRSFIIHIQPMSPYSIHSRGLVIIIIIHWFGAVLIC